MTYKLKGIVIREAPKGEAGKLLTVLTERGSVINVNAKGVRKISAAYLKSAQLFAFSEMLLYEKNGYYTLTEASLIADFYPIREDVKKYALACYICEAAGSFAVTDDGGNVLRLVLNSLFALENSLADCMTVKAAFELRLCAECGFAPDLSECENCGDTFQNGCLFSLEEGVSACAECATILEFPVTLSENERKAAEHIVTCDMKRFLSFRVPEKDMLLLAEHAEKYLLLRAERGFKTLSFYKHCEELK